MASVLIIAEHLEGRVAPSTPELITAGRRLAAALGDERDARIVVLGSDVRVLANHLAGYTLDVLLAESPALAEYAGDSYVQAVRGIVESNAPRIVLVAHTSQGYDFAPALAGAMDLPLVTNCLAVDFAGDRLVATRRLLNEKVQAQVEIRSERPIVVTMRPGAEKPMGPAAGMMKVTAVPVTIDPSTVRETFVRLERPQVEDIDLSGADIIVSAGRGIQKKENLALIEEFAKVIGGVVGASRPLTDMDWLPKTRQVGQSGKTVRPKLYVACGISGAMQHVAGMKDASLIVAINTDPTAPIFEIAHVGFVADVLKLLPATLKELKA
ncbi:MAG TPA: electron transfer flavoprotein subunit alpha/FixB family protein [Thermoplasmata archaeon]|nr:electron transfer flavoprotein subunit alpha/FixB family protein [Thermoplasmata archaeon]